MQSFGTRLFIRSHIALYRLTGGALGANLAGLEHILLTTTGAKTGLARTLPLATYIDGDRYLVVASNSGSDKYPAWWHNVKANPDVHVQYRKRKCHMHAEVLTQAERDEIWPQMIKYNRIWGSYEKKTKRPIPVVALTIA